MSAAESALVPGAAPSAGIPLSEQGPAPTRAVVAFGFWLFLLSDIVIFAALFATYAVLSQSTAGGPTGAQLFDRGHVLVETACLLLSSFTCGLLALAMERRSTSSTYGWGTVTFLLGLRSSRWSYRNSMGCSYAAPFPSEALSCRPSTPW
jgi:heme/copper-type cytochrome/quinol oxidase subunit 3